MNHSELIAQRLRNAWQNHTGHEPSESVLALAIEEAADALQALERVPMTQAEVVDGFCKRSNSNSIQFVSMFSDGVRFAEAHYGITPPESKG